MLYQTISFLRNDLSKVMRRELLKEECKRRIKLLRYTRVLGVETWFDEEAGVYLPSHQRASNRTCGDETSISILRVVCPPNLQFASRLSRSIFELTTEIKFLFLQLNRQPLFNVQCLIRFTMLAQWKVEDNVCFVSNFLDYCSTRTYVRSIKTKGTTCMIYFPISMKRKNRFFTITGATNSPRIFIQIQIFPIVSENPNLKNNSASCC